MKKLFAVLICAIMCIAPFTSCKKLCSHRWDEGVIIEDASGGYVLEFTCLRCGNKHRDTITIIPPEN